MCILFAAPFVSSSFRFSTHRRRPCRASPRASNGTPSEDKFRRAVAARRPSASLLSVSEAFRGAPWSFRRKRLYLVDLDAAECDVLEDGAQLTAPVGVTAPAGTDNLALRVLKAVLLPAGWPATLGPGYTAWVRWHIGRQLFRNAYYVLGTTSLLYSLGLGTGQALAVGASLKWVLKDGLGMGTKLLVSTRLAGIVDRDPKRWRCLGDSLMAVSAGVEIMSVTRPVYFLLFGTVAALLKEAAGAMSGPSYRVFLDAFAINSNIGDVSSRGEGQVVVGNLMGLALGVGISGILGRVEGADRLLYTLAFYGVLAAGHLRCTFNAVSTVQLKTLNWQRLNIILDKFLVSGKIPSVEEVNKQERVLWPPSPSSLQKRLRVGTQLLDFAQCGRDVSRALGNAKNRYIVAFNKESVGIMLRDDVRTADLLQAVLQGRRLLNCVDAAAHKRELSREEVGELTKSSYEWTEKCIGAFVSGLEEAGWSTAKLLIATGDSRYSVTTAG